MLQAAVEFISPAFIDTEEGGVYFQGAAAGMVGALDFKAFAVVDATGDIEDHGVVEAIGAGEADAVVSVGLGEMGFLFVIVGMVHEVIK